MISASMRKKRVRSQVSRTTLSRKARSMGVWGWVFADDDGRLGIDAGLKRVHAGNGLARDGAWAGGFGRVAAVSFDLTKSGHGASCENEKHSQESGFAWISWLCYRHVITAT